MQKVVQKPWGKEVWLELNDKYCYKRIYINAGTRTSFQYHEKKLETNYIISGSAEIWLENESGEIEKSVMGANDFFTVQPPKKHRVIAITDLILQEVSTPEVDDVIRIQDDANRKDGRLEYEHKRKAACILTAGTGRRMGKLSDMVNKALLPINNKAAISHMIEKIPEDYDIVVALGFKKEMVKEYCLAAHPDRKFIFVDVGEYEGEKTGPSYSIHKCKDHLQRPFFFMTSDAFILEALPTLKDNWLGISETSIPELYSTVEVVDGNIINFKNKDKKGYENAFIGVASIYDFKKFWEQLSVESGEIVSAFYDTKQYQTFRGEKLTWYDLGTIDNYMKARDKFQDLEKLGILKLNGEFVYKVNQRFIKLSNNSQSVLKKIERRNKLNKFTPPFEYEGQNVFCYKFIDGKTLYEIDDLTLFNKFLTFAKKHLWNQCDAPNDLIEQCDRFYRSKTLSRLEKLLVDRNEFLRGDHIVNGKPTRDIYDLLKTIDWQLIYKHFIPTTTFHGDLQFDNIIYTNSNEFKLIDWRDDFGGSTEVGDVYYDLAKIYGGTLLSYSMMKEENSFEIAIDNNDVIISHEPTGNLKLFLSDYRSWIVENNYNLFIVEILTALIFLNMAPLHSKKMGDFLFFKSKYMLEKLNDK